MKLLSRLLHKLRGDPPVIEAPKVLAVKAVHRSDGAGLPGYPCNTDKGTVWHGGAKGLISITNYDSPGVDEYIEGRRK